MNKDNVLVSYQAVKERKKFHMLHWFDTNSRGQLHCGAAACIGGCTALTTEFKKAGGSIIKNHHGFNISLNGKVGYEAMAEFWEVDQQIADDICGDPDFYDFDYLNQITRDMALQALNYLLENGTTEGFKVSDILIMINNNEQTLWMKSPRQ